MAAFTAELPQVGELVAGRYRIVSGLGTGQYGCVSECLAKDPADRPTMAEVAERLGKVDSASSPVSPRRLALVAALAGLAVAAAIALLATTTPVPVRAAAPTTPTPLAAPSVAPPEALAAQPANAPMGPPAELAAPAAAPVTPKRVRKRGKRGKRRSKAASAVWGPTGGLRPDQVHEL